MPRDVSTMTSEARRLDGDDDDAARHRDDDIRSVTATMTTSRDVGTMTSEAQRQDVDDDDAALHQDDDARSATTGRRRRQHQDRHDKAVTKMAGEDGESLDATSSVPDKVLDDGEALDADSSVQGEVLINNSPGRYWSETVVEGILVRNSRGRHTGQKQSWKAYWSETVVEGILGNDLFALTM